MAARHGLRAFLRSLVTRKPAPRTGHDARVGARGERIAARFLRRAGYKLLERNTRVRTGEMDLICRAPDGRTIVFVEVKTRLLRDGLSTGEGIAPEVNITHAKRQQLFRVGREVARQRGWLEGPLRIDVVAVEIPAKGKPVVRHHVDGVR